MGNEGLLNSPVLPTGRTQTPNAAQAKSSLSLTPHLPQLSQIGIVDLLTYNPTPNSQVKRKRWANTKLTPPQEF